MKKGTFLLLILTLAFLTMGDDCDDDPAIPNPGFRIVTSHIIVRIPGGLPREEVLRGSVTSGALVAPADNASGSRNSFPNTTAQSSGQFDVPGGIAPGLWRLNAIANWSGCEGQFGYRDIQSVE